MKPFADYFSECFEPKAKLSPQQFEQVVCHRCRNAECHRAGWGSTKWSRRMDTQVERLLENPSFADENDPKYQGIRATDFPDMLRKAMAIEIAERRGDWSVPTETDAVAFVSQMASGNRFVAPEPEPQSEPPPPALVVPPAPPAALPVARTVAPVTGPERRLFMPRADNTTIPEGGLMVGGGPAPKQPEAPAQAVADPWAVPEKPKNIVAVGAKVRMGSGPMEKK